MPAILQRIFRGGFAAAAVGAVLFGGLAAAQAPSAPPPAAPPPSVDPGPGGLPDVPPIPAVPGQLNLTEEQRQQIRQRVEQEKPDVQPVPRAFAPAVGMMAPPELKLRRLPQDLRNIPGIAEDHEYVMLSTGVLMIVGERRLVTAMIGPPASR